MPRRGSYNKNLLSDKEVKGPSGFIREACVVRALKELNPKGKNILDIGCGNGGMLLSLSDFFPSNNFFGIEIDPVHHSIAKQRAAASGKDITLWNGDFLSFTFQQEFDIVYCVDVLEHIQDDLGFLKKMYSVLSPDGAAVIHTPALLRHFWIERLIPRQSDHARDGYNYKDLTGKLREAGFGDIKVNFTFGKYGTKAWLLSRMANSILSLPLRWSIYPRIRKLVQMELEHPPEFGKGKGMLVKAVKQ